MSNNSLANTNSGNAILISNNSKELIFEDEILSLKLFDSRGLLIKEIKTESGQQTKISFNDLSDGLYFALLFKNEKIKVMKFLLVGEK